MSIKLVDSPSMYLGNAAVDFTPAFQTVDGVIKIPLGTFIFDAKYTQDGNNLTLEDGLGRKFTVEDYFSFDPLPKLANELDASIDGIFAAKLSGPNQIAQNTHSISDLGIAIGRVESQTGQTTVQHSNGISETLTLGKKIYFDDIIQTGSNTAVGILLSDETVLSIGANSRMVVDKLVFDSSSHDGFLGLSFLKGVFSFVSGKIAQNDYSDVKLTVPFGSIGIRGTEFVVDIDSEGTTTVSVIEGSIATSAASDNSIVNAGHFITFGASGFSSIEQIVPASLESKYSALLGAQRQTVYRRDSLREEQETKNQDNINSENSEHHPNSLKTPSSKDDALQDRGNAKAEKKEVIEKDIAVIPGTDQDQLPIGIQVSSQDEFNENVDLILTADDSFLLAVAETTELNDLVTNMGEIQYFLPEPVAPFENTTKKSASFEFYGSSGSDILTGTSNNDTIIGGGGNDTLDGGAGNDYLETGSNNGFTFINGSTGNDIINFANTGGAYTLWYYDLTSDDINQTGGTSDGLVINMQSGTVDKGDAGTDTLLNLDQIQTPPVNGMAIGGSQGDDLIMGYDYTDRYLSFRGRAGNDTLVGEDAAFNRLDYKNAEAGVNVIFGNVTKGTGTTSDDGDGAADTFVGMDDVRGSFFDDTLTGSIFNDSFIGLDGDDLIIGGDSLDTLTGGVGRDTLTGGNHSDVFKFDALIEVYNQLTDDVIPGGLADEITDFVSGMDVIQLDGNEFSFLGGWNAGDDFVNLGATAYNGTNAGIINEGKIIFGENKIYYDDSSSEAGYTVIAETTGSTVTAGDIVVVT